MDQPNICVRVDEDQLRRRLAKEGLVLTTSQDLHRWLNAAGFTLCGNGWYCDGPTAIAKLRGDEILNQWQTRVEQDVTFVERPQSQS